MDGRAAEKLIAMINNPEFDSKDVDPDLHNRMEICITGWKLLRMGGSDASTCKRDQLMRITI